MITATIIADSISAHTNQRITSFELQYPRFVHCFDEQTEVLARLGKNNPEFMTFPKAKALNAEVAQYNPTTNEITFVKPVAFVKNTGLQTMITFEANKLSLAVTDKHRMLIEQRTTNNVFVQKTVTADNFIKDYVQCRIRTAGICTEKQVFTKEELALMVWYASDGSKSGNKINFHFNKERKINAVVSLLDRMQIPYSIHTYERTTNIRLDKPYWVDDCYDELGNKKLPEQALYMDMDSYQMVKEALLLSDGSISNQEFNNSSKVYAEQIQILAHLHNDAMNLKCYGKQNRLFKSSFQKTNYISLRRDKDVFYSEVKNATVYCVTVPSSYVMVRRNGIVHISGNCELMTHRQFSRNSASSRAIPIDKMIELVQTNTAEPIHWGSNKSGMQAGDEITNTTSAINAWIDARNDAIKHARKLQSLGLHKQIVNRVLEPFQTIKVLVTATNFDNFFNLRCHKDAQPEIKYLADLMYQAMQESTPMALQAGQWHLPYVKTTIGESNQIRYFVNDELVDLDTAIKISCSCAAQVSYRKNDTSIEKAISIYDKLVNSDPVHASAFEHCATPIDNENPKLDGVTAFVRNSPMTALSGNFTHWVQYRQLIPNHDCKSYKGDN